MKNSLANSFQKYNEFKYSVNNGTVTAVNGNTPGLLDIISGSLYVKFLVLFSDLISKSLLILTTFLSIFGLVVIWLRLNELGIQREFISVVSSPSVLMSVAVYSLALIFFLSLILLMPGLLIASSDQNWSSDFTESKKNKVLIWNFSITFTVMAVFTTVFYIIDFKSDEGYYTIWFLLLIIFSSIFLSLRHRNIISTQPWEPSEYGRLFLSFLTVIGAQTILLFCIVIMVNVALFLTGDSEEWVGLALVAFFYFIYCFTLSIAVSNRNKISLVSYVILSIIIVCFLFKDLSANSISRLGIGGFNTSIVVDGKYIRDTDLSNLCSVSVDDTLKCSGLVRLENIWMVLSLKDKVIISINNKSEFGLSIPSAAIMNESLKITHNDDSKID